MKTLLVLLFVAGAALSSVCPAHAAVDPKLHPYDGPVLLVQVDVPLQWRPFLEDDIEQAFAERFETVFRERGFAGRLRIIQDADEKLPRERLNILTVQLIEWRVDRLGHVLCRFTASVRTTVGQRDLGTFVATAFDWSMDRNRWKLRQTLDDVARQALNDLYDEMLATKLLPTEMIR